MPLNAFIAKDAVLDGSVQARKWMREFMEQWEAPERDLERAKMLDEAVSAWELMPDQLRNQLMRDFPEQYAQAEKRYRTLKGAKDANIRLGRQ